MRHATRRDAAGFKAKPGQVCPWVRLSQSLRASGVGSSCMVRPRRRKPMPSGLRLSPFDFCRENIRQGWLSLTISHGVQYRVVVRRFHVSTGRKVGSVDGSGAKLHMAWVSHKARGCHVGWCVGRCSCLSVCSGTWASANVMSQIGRGPHTSSKARWCCLSGRCHARPPVVSPLQLPGQDAEPSGSGIGRGVCPHLDEVLANHGNPKHGGRQSSPANVSSSRPNRGNALALEAVGVFSCVGTGGMAHQHRWGRCPKRPLSFRGKSDHALA